MNLLFLSAVFSVNGQTAERRTQEGKAHVQGSLCPQNTSGEVSAGASAIRRSVCATARSIRGVRRHRYIRRISKDRIRLVIKALARIQITASDEVAVPSP